MDFVQSSLVLTSLGIFVTGRLSLFTLRVLPRKCLFFPTDPDCFNVPQGRYRWTFGIPNAFLGFFVYLLLALLGVGMWVGNAELELLFRLTVWSGAMFSVYFTYVQARILKEFCPWCLASAIIFFLLLLMSVFA